jgi:hypothetical protein
VKWDVVASPWGDGTIFQVPLDEDGNAVGSATAIRCSGRVEFSDRRASDFPASWGDPVGSPYSEARAAWVAENVRITQVESWIRGGNARTALALARALSESD